MFKPGDKIKCVDLGNHIITNIKIGEVYTFRKSYTIYQIHIFEFEECYNSDCFILSVKDIRKQKLQQICLNQEIK